MQLLITLLLVLMLGGVSCGKKEDSPTTETPGASAPSGETQAETETETRWWTCAMHPQIQMPEPGTCPICGMDLIPVESESPQTSSEAPADTIWTCAMHPQIQMPEPGTCPICGMDLIPVVKGEEASSATQEDITVRLDPAIARLAQVEVVAVSRDFIQKKLFVTGKIEWIPENVRIFSSPVEGRIERLRVANSWERVRTGSPLFLLYSPELIVAAREIQALQDSLLKEVARERLILWQLDPRAVEQGRGYFEVYSPYAGFAIEVYVREGQYVKEGTPLYKIADMSEVWVILEVPLEEAHWLEGATHVEFTVNTVPGKIFRARIEDVEREARGAFLWIRARVTNPPGYPLVPGDLIVAQVRIRQRARRLLIPESSVLWTGRHAYVWVADTSSPEWQFEIREVQLGARTEYGYEVLSGLHEGELIVRYGAFRIDAYAQIFGKRNMIHPPQEAGESPPPAPGHSHHHH